MYNYKKCFKNVIISFTTTPIRLKKFVDNLEFFEKNNVKPKYVLINICKNYKRFEMNNFIVENEVVEKISRINHTHRYNKYILNYTEDLGPITKLIGAFKFMTTHKMVDYKLVIIDDDTCYFDECLYTLTSFKSPHNIVGYSGFNFDLSLNYIKKHTENDYYSHKNNYCSIIEGYGSVCFDYSNIDLELISFVSYYNCISWLNEEVSEENEINQFLKACFLGDDFIISFHYKKKYSIEAIPDFLNNNIKQLGYGFENDALHKNNVFNSNMKTYRCLLKNYNIYDVFLKKMRVCRELKNKFLHS